MTAAPGPALSEGLPAGELRMVFHDSEVARAARGPGGLVLQFSAAACAAADPGRRHTAPPSGYLAPVVITLVEPDVNGPLDEAVGRLTAGRWQTGQGWQPSLPVPVDLTGPITLELAFANGTQLLVRAHGLSCRPGADARWVESWQC